MSSETFWIGMIAVYIPSVLPIFYRLQAVMNISEEQERTQHQKKTIQYLSFWVAGLALLILLRLAL
jgi:hypothetical protein